MIKTEVLDVDQTEYKVKNPRERVATVYIKSQRRPGRTLRHPPPGTIDTPEASYLPLVVPAKGERTLSIEWLSPVRRAVAVNTQLATTVLRLYLGGGQVPPAVRPVLDKIMIAKDRVDQLLVELKSNLGAEQARVRANLDLLRKVRGNAKLRYTVTRNLARLEDELGKLTARYVKLDEERAALEAHMRTLIGQVTLDAMPPTAP